MHRATSLSIQLLTALALAGCGETTPTPPAPTPDLSNAVYDESKVLEVSIELPAADWDKLRYQMNAVDELVGANCQDGPITSVYEYVSANVTVNGQTFSNVGVRKKGFFGSASLSKPSIKIDFDQYVPNQAFSGVEKLTLNNAVQDVSTVKQCLAYQVFREAGVAAPRCNLAHVTVNGKDLGIYVNVEGIGDPMLRRFFQDDTGNLYEGQLSDFRPGWMATYEKKSNITDPDRSDLDAVTNALTATDAELEAKLGAVLDLEHFYHYWAVESLIGSWDGYTNDNNNHLVYHDPTSGKMFFIPWGQDMTFDASDPFSPSDRPQSVSANGAVPHRLYEVPATRAKYIAAMKDVLANAWKEDKLTARADQMIAQMKPLVSAEQAAFIDTGYMSVRDFIMGRRAVVEKELAMPKDWPYPLSGSPCQTTEGSVSGTFSTTWGSTNQMNPFATGQGTMDFVAPLGAMPTAAAMVGSAAGLTTEGKMGVGPWVQLVAAFPDGKLRTLVLFVDTEVYKTGVDIPFDWQQGFGYFLDIVNPQTNDLAPLGGLIHGKIRFDAAGTKDGEPVSGTFTGEFAK